MIKEDLFFYNSKQNKMAASIYRNATPSKEGVIFSHGLFSSKDSFKVQQLAEPLVEAGFTLFAFNYSIVEQLDQGIVDLSLWQEVDDLTHAIDFFCGQGIDSLQIIGSSMGGANAILYSDKTSRPIHSLILIAAPFNLRNLIQKISHVDNIEALNNDEITDISGIFLRNHFIKETANIDLISKVKSLSLPTLLINGDKDELIDLQIAKEVYQEMTCPKEMVIIPGGNHSLINPHEMDILRKKSIDWLITHRK